MNLNLQDVAPLSAALSAAIENRLLAALAERPGSAADIAARCKLDERACQCVLDIFEACGLTTRDGDRYGAGPELSELAARPRPLGLAELGLWRHAPTFLRTGEPLLTMDAAPAEREDAYRNVVAELAKIFASAAAHLAERCGLSPRSILDVGCGSGVWSLALASRLPEARVTGMDLPAVLEQFRARASALGLDDRIDTIEGDMHKVPVPTGQWDLLIIANVLRLEPADSARSLIKRFSKAVRTGGSILVVDALASGTPAADRTRTSYAFHLAMRTRSGRVHSAGEIAEWMSDADFEAARPVPLDKQFTELAPLGALVARKI